jgi:alpha-L-fucosidase
MFVHFGPYTWLENRGRFQYQLNEAEAIVDPVEFVEDAADVKQWVSTAKQSGMGYIILTAKHQDGYCLWPTLTDSPHSTRDIVSEYVAACRKADVKIGLYFSPFDKSGYHTVEQLTELLTNYGKIDYLFIDGYGCERHPHDWKVIGETIRRLQPDIILSNGYSKNSVIFTDGAPDVRWIGNEKGYVGNNTATRIKCMGKDEKVKRDMDLVPSCFVRLGNTQWFYLEGGMGKYKSEKELKAIYDNSIPRGVALVVNASPDKTGKIPEAEINLLNTLKRRKNGTV